MLVQVLHADLASLGTVKTLPYLAMFGSSNLGGWLGDYLICQRKMPTARARKFVNTLGTCMHILKSCLQVSMPVLTCNAGIDSDHHGMWVLSLPCIHANLFV